MKRGEERRGDESDGGSVGRAGVVDGPAHRRQWPAGFAPPVEHRTPDRLSLPGAFTAVVVQAVLIGADPHPMAFPVGTAGVLIAARRPLAIAQIQRRAGAAATAVLAADVLARRLCGAAANPLTEQTTAIAGNSGRHRSRRPRWRAELRRP